MQKFEQILLHPYDFLPEIFSDVWSEKNEGENKKRLCYKEDGKSTEELVYN